MKLDELEEIARTGHIDILDDGVIEECIVKLIALLRLAQELCQEVTTPDHPINLRRLRLDAEFLLAQLEGNI